MLLNSLKNKFKFLKDNFVRSILIGVVVSAFYAYNKKIYEEYIIVSMMTQVSGLIFSIELAFLSVVKDRDSFGVLSTYRDQIILASFWLVYKLSANLYTMF